MKLYLIQMHGCFHIVFEFAEKKYQLLGSAKLRREMVLKLNAKGISEHACWLPADDADVCKWLHIYLEMNVMWNRVYEEMVVTPELLKCLNAPCQLQAPTHGLNNVPIEERNNGDLWHVEKQGNDFNVVRDAPVMFRLKPKPQVQEQGEHEINWGSEGAPTFRPYIHQGNQFSIL